MKKLLLKSVLLLCALIVGSSSVWADDSYTITFSNSANSASSISSTTGANTTIASASRGYVTSQPYTVNSGNCYYGGPSDAEKASIRVGKSGNNASLTIALSNSGQVKASSIVVNCYKMTGNKNSSATLSVNGMTAQSAPASAGDLTFTYTNATDITSITLASVTAVFINSITVNISASTKKTADLSFDIPSYKVAPYTAITQTVNNPNGLSITYKSDDEDIAYVDQYGEVITGDKIGTATITASSEATSEYDAGSATYTITTYDPAANDGSEGKPYTVAEALTKIAALADNGTIQSVYVKGKVNEVVKYNDSYKSINYYIEDLDDDTKTLYVYSGKGVGNVNFTAETDLTVGDEVMIFGTLQKYVKNSTTTPEFTSNNYIAQYKHGTDPEVKSLQVNAAEYRTYVASANLVVPTGVKAFIATSSSADELTLTSVPKIKEGTPVILNATEGYYSFEIADETVTYPNANLLKISDGTVTNGVYVLAKKGDDVKFYKWAGGALSPGKVYVEAPSSSAREYLDFVFDNEATAIETVKTNKIDGQYYNLAGQCVANPTKGLYIVNGNKVIIK